MAKKLILLRHGKAEDGGLFTSDFNRNLNEKGINQIVYVAHQFKNFNYTPDKILCSSAKRTVKTLEVFIENTKFNVPIEYKENLYLVHEMEILEIIQNESCDCIMVVGHNNGISNLAYYFTKEIDSMLKTGEMVIIEFEANYHQYKGKLLNKISIRNKND